MWQVSGSESRMLTLNKLKRHLVLMSMILGRVLNQDHSIPSKERLERCPIYPNLISYSVMGLAMSSTSQRGGSTGMIGIQIALIIRKTITQDQGSI